MRKYFVIILIVLALVACSRAENKNIIEINGKEIMVEMADTPAEHYRGLSNRKSLCEDCGMLFEFNNKKIRTFVMRDMNFPLDIIWIDDNIVIGVSKNLQPEGSGYKNYYKSPAPVDYVLEVNAGFADGEGIEVGDEVKKFLISISPNF